MEFTERDLVFDFTGAERVLKLDEQGLKQDAAHGLKLVDFAIRERDRLVLVEVKDPNDSLARPEDSRHYARKLRHRGFVREDLAPKCRDSYCYLHLMGEDDVPLWFVLLLGVREGDGVGPAELTALGDLLQHGLRCETHVPWRRQYVEAAIVATPDTWGQWFPYPVRRVPQIPDEGHALPRPARYRAKRPDAPRADQREAERTSQEGARRRRRRGRRSSPGPRKEDG